MTPVNSVNSCYGPACLSLKLVFHVTTAQDVEAKPACCLGNRNLTDPSRSCYACPCYKNYGSRVLDLQIRASAPIGKLLPILPAEEEVLVCLLYY